MRDPAGRVRFEGDLVVRQLSPHRPAPAFLLHPVAATLVQSGALVPFEFSKDDASRVESPRYEFVTFPTEWADAQLRAAADLTLDVSEGALPSGFELKDASAWNVVFDGSSPRFCDHLSFEPIRARHWWAFGQFCRHFTFPLACAQWRGLHTREAFQMRRDGIAVDQARTLLGWRGRFSRLMPLLISASRAEVAGPPPPVDPSSGSTLHGRVFEYARRSLIGPRSSTNAQASAWAGYVRDRQHYTDAAVTEKAACVARWLESIRPHTVLDLGCNTGEFSAIALQYASRVISVDADHDCVQRVFLGARGDTRVHPVIADLGDLRGGRGWAATEHPGLIDRLAGQSDVAMMLALVHHLAVSEGIPLDEIADLAAHLTTRHLIVEVLHHADPMVRHLASQRQRDVGDFTIPAQIDAFGRHFDLVDRLPLPGGCREILLMKLRA